MNNKGLQRIRKAIGESPTPDLATVRPEELKEGQTRDFVDIVTEHPGDLLSALAQGGVLQGYSRDGDGPRLKEHDRTVQPGSNVNILITFVDLNVQPPG